MDSGRVVLLVVAMMTALNWAVHWYTQTVTYRLFPVVAGVADGAGFVRYHRAYERRLPRSVYVPWSALTVASVLAVLVRPDGLGIGWPIVLLVLNASIAPVSIAFAAPVHRRVDAQESLGPVESRALLRWNGVRLAIATVALAVALGLAVTHLA